MRRGTGQCAGSSNLALSGSCGGHVCSVSPPPAHCERLTSCAVPMTAGAYVLFGMGAALFVSSLVANGVSEFHSSSMMRTIQLGRASLKESSCGTPDPALNDGLVHVACELNGAVPLGSNIVGMQDVPAAQRVGMRLESRCEVQEWMFTQRTRRTCYANRGWSTTFDPLAGTTSLERACKEECRFQNGGRRWPYFRGNPCVNTHPSKQSWWTPDMKLSTWYAVESVPHVSVGGFRVPADLRENLHGQTHSVRPALDCKLGPAHCPPGVSVVRFNDDIAQDFGAIMLLYSDLTGPTSSQTPMRRQFRLYNMSHASVVAKQVCSDAEGCTFAPWSSPHNPNYQLYLATDGVVPAVDMLLESEGENIRTTWLVRLATVAGACLGLEIMIWMRPFTLFQAAPNLQIIQTERGLVLVNTLAEYARRRRLRDLTTGVLVGCVCHLLVSAVSWELESRQNVCWACLWMPLSAGLFMCALSLVLVQVHVQRGGLQRERVRERASWRERARRAVVSAPVSTRILEEREREPLGSEHLERLLRTCPHGYDNSDECAACSTDAVCSVCMSTPRSIRVGPCGHACLCAECHARVMQRNKRCPVCREHITWFVSGAAIARESTYIDSSELLTLAEAAAAAAEAAEEGRGSGGML